ncbi:MAG TPA: hypothetical protein VK590_11210 [Saprospiraceae bacterium]|nr:hypothetical protein [Saprospiraceae bacterium]
MAPTLQVLTSKQHSSQKHVSSYMTAKSIADIQDDWKSVLKDENILLSPEFLLAIEENPPQGMQFRYTLVFNDYKEAIGLVYFQIQYFNANDSIANKESVSSPCFFNTIHNFFKGILVKQVEFNTFVCGNLLLTGEHGFYFKPGYVDPKEECDIISNLVDKIQQDLEADGVQCNVCLIKDFFEETHSKCEALINKQYHEFTIQPNMIFNVRPEWSTMDDYLDSLQSKYRIRAKRAFKKAIHITKRVLTLMEIENHEADLYSLYLEVAENAGFNVVNLNTSYFTGLKKQLGDKFEMTGYYDQETLVGFFTTIINGKELEAHFLGYSKKENLHAQLYLNMLFDIISVGIRHKSNCINFARTALEIKSSVGAEAFEMYCYMKHRNNFSNKFFRPLLDYLNPKVEWLPRHPYKDSVEDHS